MGFMVRFNDWLGDKLAFWLSTMAMFYGVAFLVVAPLLFQRPTSLVAWMQYTISVFFQGVALPVLGYVSRKSGEKSEQLLQETHDTVMNELELIKENLQMATEDREQLKLIMDKLNSRVEQFCLNASANDTNPE